MATARQRILHGAVSGGIVHRLQLALRDGGFDPGALDGVYGPDTARAVWEFQVKGGLPPDGIVGLATWRALQQGPTRKRLEGQRFPGSLHGATSGEDVRRAQKALRRADFDPGDVDGVYGPNTQRAVLEFQRAKELPVSGIIDSTTWDALVETPGPEVFLLVHPRDVYRLEPMKEAFLERQISWAGLDFGEGELAPAMPEAAAAVVVYLTSTLLKAAEAPIVKLSLEAAQSRRTAVLVVLGEALDVASTPFAHLPVFSGDAADPREAARAVAEAVAGLVGREAAPTPPAEPRSWLPGFSADSTEGKDLLGIQRRVEFLGSVLAARELSTPLAIGLFGDWGSGKSFFMRRMQECIARITAESVRAEAKGETSYYCSYVRQVSFNAWLYADSDLWPSLATQVFQSVTTPEPDAPDGQAQQEVDLAAYQARAMTDLQGLVDERRTVESEDAALERRIEELTGEIAQKRAQIWELRSGAAEADAAVRGMRAFPELVAGVRRIRRAWSGSSLAQRAGLATAVAVALAFAVVAMLVPGWITWAAAAALPAWAILALLAKLFRYVDDAARLALEAQGLQEKKRSLQTEREQLARRKGETDQRLESFRARPLLPDFARTEAARWAGRERLGQITEMRLAFEQLSQLIGEGRAARPVGGGQPAGAPPVDRVIVYVDDLDRCHHGVVVQTLEALKLLLDLPHFVVVVGVDSRWLIRSLEIHFAQLLEAGGEAWAATPQNYLEKIFQYSLVLPRMTTAGFGSLIESLLPTEGVFPLQAARAEPRDDETAADAATRDASSATGERPISAGRGRDAGAPAPAPPTEADVLDVEAPVSSDPDHSVDLTPAGLVVTGAELEFVQGLAPLFETPRAAKRLTNVYRLIRVSVGADTVLTGASYEPLLVLLSIAIGFPALAPPLFQALREHRPDTWSTFVELLLDFGERASSWRRLATLLEGIWPDRLGKRPISDFAEWMPIAAEFSLHPWRDLMTDPEPSSA